MLLTQMVCREGSWLLGTPPRQTCRLFQSVMVLILLERLGVLAKKFVFSIYMGPVGTDKLTGRRFSPPG